jgi:hypothetical protein
MAASVVASLVTVGYGTWLHMIPLLWSWSLVDLLFGSRVANQQPWLSDLIAGLMHGTALAIACGISDYRLRRYSKSARFAGLALVTGVFLAFMFFLGPATDGP